MKILYLNCIDTNTGYGAENFMQSAFEQCGQTPSSIDYRKHKYDMYRFMKDTGNYDALFVQKGDGVPPVLLDIVKLPRFFWACDVLGSRPGQPLNTQDPVYDVTQYRHLSSGMYDHYFVRTPNCINTVVSRGWVKKEECSILLSSFDPDFHKPDPGMKKDIDALFVGSMTPRRRRIFEQAGKHSKILAVSKFGPEMVNLFTRAKIVINIHAGPLVDTETRVYEVLGCGAFLLTEKLSPENPFSDRELVQFDSVDDMVAKIEYYLSHGDEREAIADHGYKAALAGHTYLHRAREVIEVMNRFANGEKIKAAADTKRSWKLRGYVISEPIFRIGWTAKMGTRRILSKIKKFIVAK